MLIHQSELRLICGHGLPPSFQVCLTPWQTFVPLYVAHKAPALSALIDQRLAVEEERSIPYQWCSTSAAEKNLHLFQQHAQFLGDNECCAVNSSCSCFFLSCVYRQSAYLLDGGNRQYKKIWALARKIIIMSTNADRVEFPRLLLRLAGPLKGCICGTMWLRVWF